MPVGLIEKARDVVGEISWKRRSLLSWSGRRRGAASRFRRAPAPLSGPERVARSLYERANGYNYETVKIFMPAGAKSPVIVPYVEHVPPDVTAGIFWMKNRDPANWRDAWQLEHVTGKYVISDKPMSAEEWIKHRAVVVDGDDAVDVTPQLEDKSK